MGILTFPVIHGCKVCFVHEDRQKIISSFLNKARGSNEHKYDVAIITATKILILKVIKKD
jgi:hypothetical protein